MEAAVNHTHNTDADMACFSPQAAHAATDEQGPEPDEALAKFRRFWITYAVVFALAAAFAAVLIFAQVKN